MKTLFWAFLSIIVLSSYIYYPNHYNDENITVSGLATTDPLGGESVFKYRKAGNEVTITIQLIVRGSGGIEKGKGIHLYFEGRELKNTDALNTSSDDDKKTYSVSYTITSTGGLGALNRYKIGNAEVDLNRIISNTEELNIKQSSKDRKIAKIQKIINCMIP